MLICLEIVYLVLGILGIVFLYYKIKEAIRSDRVWKIVNRKKVKLNS